MATLTADEYLAEKTREIERKKKEEKPEPTSTFKGQPRAFGGAKFNEPKSKALERKAYAPSPESRKREQEYHEYDYSSPKT